MTAPAPSTPRPPLELLDRLRRAVAAYARAVEVEADERLYVRPLLEVEDLLQLHVRHCHEVIHKSVATQVLLAEISNVSQQRVSELDGRLRAAGAIDAKFKVTETIGRVGVSVVQYCHHEWVDEFFGEIVSDATESTRLKLRHPDRATFIPQLYGLVQNSLFDIDIRLDKKVDEARALLMIKAHVERRGESARIRDLAVEVGVPARTFQDQIRRLREKGLVEQETLGLTSKGLKISDESAEILLSWVRSASLAMTAWSTGEFAEEC